MTVFLVLSGTKGLIMACCWTTDTLDTAYFSVNAIMCSKTVLKEQLPEGMCAWEHSYFMKTMLVHCLIHLNYHSIILKEELWSQQNGTGPPPP